MYAKILASTLAASLALPAFASSKTAEAETETAQLPADQQAFLDACEPWDEWDKPAPPFKIYGNSYYVGTCGISAILIVGEERHTLIDSGTEAGAEVVINNVKSLGHEPSDIGMILASHEHHDHVGGMARLIEAGATGLVVNRDVWLVYAQGEPDPRDPQFAIAETMKAANVLGTVEPGMRLGLQENWFQSIATPGHTPGALSWQWESCEGGVCKTIVYADSLSPVSADGYRFSDHPEYVTEYHAGIERLGAVNCDILLAAHPSHGRLFQWLEKGSLLTMDKPCQAYAAKKRSDLDKRLAKEAADQAGAK